MDNPTGNGSPKRAAKGPAMAGFLLLLVIAFCLYWLHVVNMRQEGEAEAALQRQSAQAERLREEKGLLESMRNKNPCEIRQWLQKAGADVIPATKRDAPAAGSTEATLERLEDATVFVLGQSGSSLTMGSGFFIAPGLVLTNRHVVARAPDAIFVINKKLGGLFPATLVAASPEKQRDYALLRVNLPGSAAMRPLAFSAEARRTQKVSVWGYPHAISKNDPKYQALISGRAEAVPELSYADGVISAVLDRNPRLIVHTAPLSPGSSGGPLADEKGDVLGINTMISLDEDSYRQTSLALHASDILRFLKENGIDASMAE
ncbi:MAG: serine protease [Desulfovibrio sp.]|jgi:S1-C subfamily serine protease|nr:serine protease [Desulfovibrio sp.]